jgi:hypothetical protein
VGRGRFVLRYFGRICLLLGHCVGGVGMENTVLGLGSNTPGGFLRLVSYGCVMGA